ncbi:hypothetical protein H6P81_013085 [Aristolochia fimbriata]|uniref:Uncharacterized protein n=1 Tax=Aristolochia fimbriata TaxID=158543 RepID=A0AAV7EGX9_ARIFI|nr:hypothetical protein H6P81_013085 [Aristolochia fimbriata]
MGLENPRRSAGSAKGKPKIEVYDKERKKGAGALITPAKTYNPAADSVLGKRTDPVAEKPVDEMNQRRLFQRRENMKKQNKENVQMKSLRTKIRRKRRRRPRLRGRKYRSKKKKSKRKRRRRSRLTPKHAKSLIKSFTILSFTSRGVVGFILTFSPI